MKKLFTLLTLALLSIGSAWALDGVETATNTGTSNTDVTGTCYTIPGTYVAGKGGTMAAPMENKGVKLRTGVDGARVVFNVTAGYTITDVVIHAVANYPLLDENNEVCIFVTKVEVDGAEVEFTGGLFPAKGASPAGTLTISDINATESIAIYFDNSNAKDGTQINAYYELTWTQPESETPTSTTVTPTEKTIAVGQTKVLTGSYTGGTFDYEWVSDNEGVATVDQEGNVTGVAPGTANITYQWADSQDDDAYKATAVITVVEPFDPTAYALIKSYDFTAMPETDLILGESAGNIWNQANNKTNEVFFCTNEGLELLAIQAAYDGSKKGWKIDADGNGLLEGSGAGRCAAIGGIMNGWIVEFNHDSGEYFYTKNDDAGVNKEVIIEEENHHVYRALEDGIMGFELTKGKHITSINIYADKTVPVNITEAGFATFSSFIMVKAPEGVTAFFAVQKDETTITLKEISDGVIPAGEGVVLAGDAGDYIMEAVEADKLPDEGNLLKANLIAGTPEEAEYYTLAAGPVFKKSEGGVLAAGKAYLVLPSTARTLNVVFERETTGISSMLNAQGTMHNEIYNLNGQRVMKAQKGLYIQNGKKVVRN